MSKIKKWPANCAWPEPDWDGSSMWWEPDEVDPDLLDEEGQELLEVREYFDSLVEEGRLNEDYSLNEEYLWDEEESDEEEEFEPEIGEEYWDNGFMIELWDEDFSHHVSLLKILPHDVQTDPIIAIRGIIGYEFVNENLLRQAFTRRAFAVQYGLSGCSEELEFLGDSVMNTVVIREIVRQLMDTDIDRPDAPFRARRSGYDEGTLSKIRSHFICKEYLAARAAELGLDQYILYGSGEEPTESSREDMMEALIGAVAVDSGWNWEALESVVDKLLCIQLTYPDEFLKATHYELFNSWHQRHFGCVPEYEVYPLLSGGVKRFACAIRFRVPDNDKGISVLQRFDVDADSRSAAREKAAFRAYSFVVGRGLWVNLKDAGLIPDLENSINQLQELYQKKYVDETPQYTFEEQHFMGDEWYCDCVCGGVNGYGRGPSKTKAKKKAAYMVLVRLMKAAGCLGKTVPRG